MAHSIAPDGATTPLPHESGMPLPLSAIREAVGGAVNWVEVLEPRITFEAPDGVGEPTVYYSPILVCHDEGRTLGMPLNRTATALTGYPIHGTVVVGTRRELLGAHGE